jgi:hypothetical protein
MELRDEERTMMARTTHTAALVGAILLQLHLVPILRAQVDQGSVRNAPWSGSYWPIRYGQLISGPLRKYDRITGHRAASWEMQQNPPSQEVPEWFGYCHAWSASSVLDREPTRSRQARAADGATVQLGVGDQKGMLTACHTDDVAQHYGIRFQGEPGEDPSDIYPDELWRVLRLYIQQRGVPLIIDLEGGPQVWNHPVYAYRVDYRREGAGNRYSAEMSLWMADDAVPSDMVGIQVSKQTYYFSFQMQGGAPLLGSAQWVEPSRNDHPDFAWYPYIVRAENPEIRYDEVKRLVGAAASQPQPSVIPPEPRVSPAVPPGLPGSAPSHPALPPNVLPSTAIVPTTPFGRETGPDEHSPGTMHTSPTSQPYFLSPMELLRLVINKTSYFPVDATVDRFDGGHYVIGEPFTVSGSIGRDGYLYLLYLNGQGQLSVLFPRPGESNAVSANERFSLPAAGVAYRFPTAGPPGTHRVKAIVTTRPLLFGSVSMWQQGRLPPGVQSRTLRLPPTQKAKFKSVLTRYGSGRAPLAEDYHGASPRAYLGDFGQDEVAFYVGPANASGGMGEP